MVAKGKAQKPAPKRGGAAQKDAAKGAGKQQPASDAPKPIIERVVTRVVAASANADAERRLAELKGQLADLRRDSSSNGATPTRDDRRQSGLPAVLPTPTSPTPQEASLKAALANALERAVRAERECGQLRGQREALRAENASLERRVKLAELKRERDVIQLGIAFSSVAVAALSVGHEVPHGSKLFPNPCLNTRNGAHSRAFEAGLQECGLTLGQLADNTIVAFHGTGNASDILCNGFDPSKRTRQLHGAGEYFAHDWETASDYARDQRNPIVIVTLLLKCKARSVLGGGHRPWFVVDNPADRSVSYCIPLMYIPLDARPLPSCRACLTRALEAFEQSMRAARHTMVDYEDDSGDWAAMAAPDAVRVLAAHASGVSKLDLGHWTYRYDWQAMVQTNTHTGKRRNIRFR